jgi:hypothetical protein
MKMQEMADLLSGLASTLEKFMGKTAVHDLEALGECLRQFPDENVSTFCNFVARAKEGGGVRRRAAPDAAKVADSVSKIQNFLAHPDAYEPEALRELASQMGTLQGQEIKAIGAQVGCPLHGRTKADNVTRLESWLLNIKQGTEQPPSPSTGMGAAEEAGIEGPPRPPEEEREGSSTYVHEERGPT